MSRPMRWLRRLRGSAIRSRVAFTRPNQEELARQAKRVETTFANVRAPLGPELYTCPCCGHRTLPERGAYDLCPECSWEDDGQDDHDSHVRRGGPNGLESLDDARQRYVGEGGSPQPHIQPSDPR